MRIRISDLMDQSCPEEIELGTEDRDRAGRIEAMVIEKIGAGQTKERRMRRKAVSILLLAAAIALLLGSAAYAVSGWFMKLRKTEEPETGYFRAVDDEGNLTTDVRVTFPDAGMVLSFEGPKERTNQPEFRCFYLPSEANFGFTDAEGWTTYLSDQGEGANLPYIISASNVHAGTHKSVINGEVTQVKEEDWGDWHVTELTSDYTNCTLRWTYERANFVLLFNSEQGWLVSVTGTAPLETLEHIAKELEIRDSGEPAFSGENQVIEAMGMFDPGRG